MLCRDKIVYGITDANKKNIFFENKIDRLIFGVHAGKTKNFVRLCSCAFFSVYVHSCNKHIRFFLHFHLLLVCHYILVICVWVRFPNGITMGVWRSDCFCDHVNKVSKRFGSYTRRSPRTGNVSGSGFYRQKNLSFQSDDRCGAIGYAVMEVMNEIPSGRLLSKNGIAIE